MMLMAVAVDPGSRVMRDGTNGTHGKAERGSI